MSAKLQIGKDVRNIAKPIVVDLSKQNARSLAKEIVHKIVKQSITKLSLLKSVPNEPETKPSHNYLWKYTEDLDF